MNQQNNELESRPDLKEVSNGIVEFAESEFEAPTAAELSNIVTQLDFGEVLLKVVKGKIQTMSVTKHYKIEKSDGLDQKVDLTNIIL